MKYSPKFIDVINFETCEFETIEIKNLLKQYGNEYPYLNNIVSILEDSHLRKPRGVGTNFEEDTFVVTFEGLITSTPFVNKVKAILNELMNQYGRPVDIEFAHDGYDFYLLQCRTQSYLSDSKPAEIPLNISNDKIVFSANKFISNGTVSDITHIVYVDPQKYGEISNHNDLLEVGKVVSKLNAILPKRKFILMGPGRWGSRGDIKLGVSVTYSDINNSSMLIEIARKQNEYVPDLSFGTHFFQDLVEANIRYLPLYPDDKGIIFNEEFLTKSKNILLDLLPGYKQLFNVIKVIDVPSASEGDMLKVYMNANTDFAVAVISEVNQKTN